MKLVSFAVISILAITVSAQIPTRLFSFKYALQRDQSQIHDKIEKLEEDYIAQQDLVIELGGLEKLEQEERKYKSMIDDIEKELKSGDLSGAEELEMEKDYEEIKKKWKKANLALVTKKNKLTAAADERDDTEIKLFILEENQERRMEQDAHSRGQTKASPGPSSPRDILTKQIAEAYQDAADLFDANADIRKGIYELYSIKERAKDPKKGLELGQIRCKFVDSYNKLYDEMVVVERRCAHAKGLQEDLGWKSLSLQFGEAFQLLWYGH
ncbi:hypothetical protein BASA50_008855 [Batrachochytrium salamandrivorans]|uniref:Uncharacterized protein n=1 Tax=Batrachochytrium salamandrivorans TaxID=1357716 RepID=A0ABQ8F308_9FUNG|nr:hypothetical protein BASA61_009551 [Batrachochytrium salamandrivorans]KAH6591205.1 hypothetical protein BASA50_008855 [Batrachochytrium salamandrivorans]